MNFSYFVVCIEHKLHLLVTLPYLLALPSICTRSVLFSHLSQLNVHHQNPLKSHRQLRNQTLVNIFTFMKFAATTLISAALLNIAAAGVWITAPIGSTKATGGQPFSVVWDDDGQSPTLQELGNADVALMTGSDSDQTVLQTLEENVPLSSTASTVNLIDKNVGPDGNVYFVRVMSKSLNDDAGNPYAFYSARFLLEGMGGSFSDEIVAQLEQMMQNENQKRSLMHEDSEAEDTEYSAARSTSLQTLLVATLAVILGASVSTL